MEVDQELTSMCRMAKACLECVHANAQSGCCELTMQVMLGQHRNTRWQLGEQIAIHTQHCPHCYIDVFRVETLPRQWRDTPAGDQLKIT